MYNKLIIKVFREGYIMNFLIVVLLVIVVLAVLAFLVQNALFMRTEYYKLTGNSLLATLYDKGRCGEYMIYKQLRFLERKGGKFLFNIYVPKTEDETTEIDVALVCSKGILVFESKNYSGWIFGNEKQKMWTQTLPQGKGKSVKKHFYNPIFQNKTHIKYLKNIVGENVPIFSVIVFSERCELKKVTYTEQNVHVIKRNNIVDCVAEISKKNESILSNEQINDIYNKLYKDTQVTEEQKNRHVETIKNKYIK